MMPAQYAIARLRRDLTIGTTLNFTLASIAAICLVLPIGLDIGFAGTLLLVVVGGVWLVLSAQSVRGSRLAASSPSLIASGRLDAAEQQIEQALHTFSLYRTTKLLSLHHLAMLRHAQRRWEDCAQLCRALLSQRLGSLQSLARQSRLLLADSLLETGDVGGAYDALAALYHQRLSLAEAMNLLAVQLDYQSRVGAWEQMFEGAGTKVQLAELMPAPIAARAEALLALAARKLDKQDWANWLRARAELLGDVNELTRARPILWELWSAQNPAMHDA